MDFDTIYGETENYFGAEPSGLLEKKFHLIERTAPVLDVGTGQGRNALFLARHGLAVHAIDPSRAAVEIVTAAAKEEGLPIKAEQRGFETMIRDAGPFAAVLLLGLIPCLPREKVEILGERAAMWLDAGGLLFVTAFTVSDPSYARLSGEGKPAGANSFVGQDGRIRTFLEPGEVARLFPRFETVHHFEGMGEMHRHGNGPPERHAVLEALLRKDASN